MNTWWVVLVEAEYAELSDLFGPYRSKEAADELAGRWNSRPNRDGVAHVKAILPPRDLVSEMKRAA